MKVTGNNWQGRCSLKMDSKGRVMFPSAVYKNETTKSKVNVATVHKTFFVTFHQVQGYSCLDFYSGKEWSNLVAQIQSLPALNPQVQAFQRFYVSSAVELQIDGQGRIAVPIQFRNYAKFDKELVFVGMGHKLEVWCKENWDQYQGALLGAYEGTLASINELLQQQACETSGNQNSMISGESIKKVAS